MPGLFFNFLIDSTPIFIVRVMLSTRAQFRQALQFAWPSYDFWGKIKKEEDVDMFKILPIFAKRYQCHVWVYKKQIWKSMQVISQVLIAKIIIWKVYNFETKLEFYLFLCYPHWKLFESTLMLKIRERKTVFQFLESFNQNYRHLKMAKLIRKTGKYFVHKKLKYIHTLWF